MGLNALPWVAMDWLTSVARQAVPDHIRRWVRDQQRRTVQVKQDLYERIIIRECCFANVEGLLNFDFTLSARRRKRGVSGLLRVRNEEEKIYHCIASIYEVFDEIVVVDNQSEDATLQIIREFKAAQDKENKIRMYSYPFKIARCGPEHLSASEDSVHSLTYYYNWALSKCSFRYVCKWDGDMVLRREAREPFTAFLRQLQQSRKMCWVVYGQAVYRDLANDHYLAKGEINGEIRIFPNGFNPRFYKSDLYEVLKSYPPLDENQFEGVLFYELKYVNTDEFSHWSIGDIPTDRKRTELKNFYLVKANDISSARFERLSATFLNDQISGA